MSQDPAMTDATMNSDNSTQCRRRLLDRLQGLIPLTFRWRSVLILFPMIVIISAVYTIESVSTERRILRSEIIKKGETIAVIAARNAELSLLSENIEQLKSSAQPLMAIKDVSFVSFLNKHAKILLHEGKLHLPESSPPLNPEEISFSEHDDAFEFTVPVVTVKATEGLFLLDESGSAPPVR